MADFDLDRNTTALIIADFYADVMAYSPHAVDRKVVGAVREPPLRVSALVVLG